MVRPKEEAAIAVPERPSLLVLHDDGEDDVVGIFADVLGQRWVSAPSVAYAIAGPPATLYGLRSKLASHQLARGDCARLIINTHRVDGAESRDDALTDQCDYEYLYTRQPFYRRDVVALFVLRPRPDQPASRPDQQGAHHVDLDHVP